MSTGVPIGADTPVEEYRRIFNGKFIATVNRAVWITKETFQLLKLTLEVEGALCFVESFWVFRNGETAGDYKKTIEFLGILGIKQGEPMTPDPEKDGYYHIDRAIGEKIGVVLKTYERYDQIPINGYTKQGEMNKIPERVYIPNYGNEIRAKTFVVKFYNAETGQTWTEMQQGLDPVAVDSIHVIPVPAETPMSVEELDKYVKDKLKEQLLAKNIAYDPKRWIPFAKAYSGTVETPTEAHPAEEAEEIPAEATEVHDNAETDDDELPDDMG